MIKKKALDSALIILLALFLVACVTAGKKEYDIGMQLDSAGKYKEAIAYLNQAIEKEPNNDVYKKSLADITESQVAKFVTAGRASPWTPSRRHRCTSHQPGKPTSSALAREIAPAHPGGNRPANPDRHALKKSLLADTKAQYAEAKQFIAAQQWVKAYFNLQQIQNRYPNYEDSYQLHDPGLRSKATRLVFRSGQSARFDQGRLPGRR